MKPKARSERRFGSPTVLKDDDPFLGATVKEWDEALTGNIEKTLTDLKVRTSGNTPKRDISKATSFDLASAVSKRLAGAK